MKYRKTTFWPQITYLYDTSLSVSVPGLIVLLHPKGPTMIDDNETSPSTDDQSTNDDQSPVQLAVGIPVVIVGVVTIAIVVFVAVIVVIKKCKQQAEVVTKDITAVLER